jgi:hypothetical protein
VIEEIMSFERALPDLNKAELEANRKSLPEDNALKFGNILSDKNIENETFLLDGNYSKTDTDETPLNIDNDFELKTDLGIENILNASVPELITSYSEMNSSKGDLPDFKNLNGAENSLLTGLNGEKSSLSLDKIFKFDGLKKTLSVDPLVYSSLMQKAENLISGIKNNQNLGLDFAEELIGKFDLISTEMNLNESERGLLAKIFQIAFAGDKDSHEGVKKLISMLDVGELGKEAKGYKLYSNAPVIVQEKSSDDVPLKERGTLAKISNMERILGNFESAENRFTGSLKNDVFGSEISSNISDQELDLKINDLHSESKTSIDKQISDSGFPLEMQESVLGKVAKQKPVRINIENLISEFGAKIGHIARTNGGDMRIKLYPEALGEVFVNVSTNDTSVKLKIVTDNSEAKNILESSLPELRSSLSSKNLNLENVKIDVNLGNSGSDFSENTYSARESFEKGKYQFAKKQGSFKHRSVGELGAQGNLLKMPSERYGNKYNFVA